jgi:hypothetical protein
MSDMPYDRARIDTWIATDLKARYPELVKPMRGALDAYDRIVRKGRIVPRDLRPILDCACSARIPLVEEVSILLARLTARYLEARNAVADMCNDKRSHVRRNAIVCLGRRTPRRFVAQILRKSLADKSASVRSKAADWALRLDLSVLVPDLEVALTKESHRDTHTTIDFSIRLLRDGYVLDKPCADGAMSITVRHAGHLLDDSTTAKEIEKKGLQAIIREIREAGPYGDRREDITDCGKAGNRKSATSRQRNHSN